MFYRLADGVNPSSQPTLRAIWASLFIVSLPMGILEFMMPIYGDDMGATAWQIGLMYSAFWLMSVLVRPLAGRLLDRYGRRPFYLGGVVTYALAMAAFLFAHNPTLLMLGRGVQGMGAALLWLSARTVMADLASEDARARLQGTIDQFGAQGAIVGALIGLTVFQAFGLEIGWMWLFLGYALADGVALLVAARGLSETLPAAADPQAGPDPQRIRLTRAWLVLLAATAAVTAGWTMVMPILVLYLKQKFHTEVWVLAAAYLPAALVWALLPGHMGRLSDRVGRKPLMVGGLALAGVASLLIPMAGGLVVLAGLWVLEELAYTASEPAEGAMVADLSGGDERGRGYGLYTLAIGVGATIGPPLGGWLYDACSPVAPFIANAVMLLACALVVLVLLPESRPPA
jgi:DHA1 family multidrug resistance protein-like MFS transporter